jgi:exonuclease III
VGCPEYRPSSICRRSLPIRPSTVGSVLGSTSDVSVLNVYAPSNSARDKVELWEELLRSLPRNCRWVLAGDWNFVEHRHDKSNNCGRLVNDGERIIFSQLLDALQVEDNFPSGNKIKFSWDNRRRDGTKVLARLDRIYAFQATGTFKSVADYEILGDSNHSDHLPVRHKILLQPKEKKKSS